MKKILIFGAILGLFADAPALSAVRDGASTSVRPSTQTNASRTTGNTARSNTEPTRNAATRAQKTLATRAGSMPIAPRTDSATRTRTSIIKPGTRDGQNASRTATTNSGRGAIITRAATNSSATTMAETKTGAAYTQCKAAYFQCMDQFCALKNDEYRRCSCSSRISDLTAVRKNLVETNEKLSEFTENLDIVGMTAAQATAINTASDGENALTRDVSASKALLTAIMNSIRGEDATVGGKWSDLNSINLSFDTTNMFGLNDTAQVVAAYNGVELYNAVYPSCRSAVASDCNDASLQRAVTAYLMAIEQDCNTVQSALETKQKELKTAVREGGAMLDLARVENRKQHNSSDMTTCINEVESAVLSEQVCGANYHKCLDNGEFIDVSTGAPIAGVVNFNELGQLLKFDFAKDAVDQKLSQNPNNQKFLKNFENKTKKFAADALDKCTEIADTVWAEYLDKALLDIYYAQQSKVKTIQNGCFDLISACYQDKEAAITTAMAALIDGGTEISLIPNKIVLTQQMCDDYIKSCNGMFGDDVIAQYITSQTETDRLAACRAVVQQCFDGFGGTNYENFYAPSSGLFTANVVDTPNGVNIAKTALDWFTLYEYGPDGERLPGYKSICAQQLADIDSCADLIPAAFGGLDMVAAHQEINPTYGQYEYSAPTGTNHINAYGWAMADDSGTINWSTFKNRRLRPTGIATEVYNQIIDGLMTQCMNVQGKFIEAQFIDHRFYGIQAHPVCSLSWQSLDHYIGQGLESNYGNSASDWHENMCPKDYTLNVDTNAWGACLCWENGGRRSKNGLFGKCVASIPVQPREEPGGETYPVNDGACTTSHTIGNMNATIQDWCTSTVNSSTGQVCPFYHQNDCQEYMSTHQDEFQNLPDGILP